MMASCFSASLVDGLPCSRDETCGPDHECAFGYCRVAGFDALADCGDGEYAQGEFCFPEDRQLEVAFSGTLQEIAWADFDGNGFVDALTISSEVSLNLNQGDGTFEREDMPLALSVEDLEALGVELENIPDTFAQDVVIIPRNVVVGDFVGSPLPDAVLALQFIGPFEELEMLSQLLASLWLVENLGEGNFSIVPLPETAPVGAMDLLTRGLQSGDFNGDGETDVVGVAEAMGGNGVQTVMLFGDPVNVLGPPGPISLGGAGAPLVGDFNGDGIDDVATANADGLTVAVALGPFGPDTEVVPEVFGVGGTPVALHLADLNDDGLLDVLVAFEGDIAGFQPWLGDGEGDFEPGRMVETDRMAFVDTGDFDGDDRLDVVSGSSNGLFVHPGYGDAQFSGAFQLRDDAALFVGVFALDDDDVLDLVSGSSSVAAVFFGAP